MPVLSENAVARVGYAGSDKDMGVRILGEWVRGEIAMVMSASSGPKDYTKNLLAMALEAKIKAGDELVPMDRIRLLCPERKDPIPFCVFRVQGRWFDCTGKEVSFS